MPSRATFFVPNLHVANERDCEFEYLRPPLAHLRKWYMVHLLQRHCIVETSRTVHLSPRGIRNDFHITQRDMVIAWLTNIYCGHTIDSLPYPNQDLVAFSDVLHTYIFFDASQCKHVEK